MNLKDKVAIITGGARMGQSVAEELGKRGAHVCVGYRSSEKSAQETVTKLNPLGVKSLAIQADMTSKKDVQKIIDQTKEKLGSIDVLVNMASIYESTPYSDLSDDDWDQNMNANLKSIHWIVQSASPELKKNKGRVINFTDWIAASGRPRYKELLPYYTSKMGVLGLTQAQALELAPEVLVNAIAPGPILPPKELKNEETKEIEKVTPLQKWGGPLEIAKTVLFLIETDFITGECIRVDGGRHIF